MAIQNGQLADADEVLNAIGLLFKNSSQVIFNAELEGFNTNLNGDGAFNKSNLDLRSGANSTGTTAGGNMQYDSANDFWWSYPTSEATYVSFDEFDDSSVDSGLWTESTSGGGSITEDTTKVRVRVNASTGNSTLTSKDLFDTYNNVIISMSTFRAQGQGAGGGSDTATTRFYLGSQVLAERTSTTNSISQYTNAKMQIIRFATSTGYTYKWRFDDGTGGGYGSWSTSSETGDVQIQFYVNLTSDGTGGDSYIDAEYVRSNTATDSDGTVTTDTVTAGSTITNAISVFKGSNATMTVSADNGSNYESITDSEIHRFSNTGTQLKMRCTIAGTGQVFNFATLYNLY